MTENATRTWYRPMVARSTGESHRASTPLELFFDLCFVVAVAQASTKLHHALLEHHVGAGVLGFVTTFFAIWWAWMNFTWFASAYDTDDGVYRLTTFVQMAGVLILAAGVPRAFDRSDFTIITIGYLVMRLAMVGQWLRAARTDPTHRVTALRYATGIAIVQVGWVARLWLPGNLFVAGFVVLAIGELLVPVWAERPGMTAWHPHHIAERYGLFTLIVLGETVLAATVAVQQGLDAGDALGPLLGLAGAGLVIVFSMWWLYFDRSAHELLTGLRSSMMWGYGHYLVFAATAAVGAGLGVVVDHARGEGHLSRVAAGYAVAVPVAVWILTVWFVHLRPGRRGPANLAYPAVAALVLLTPYGPAGVQVAAGLLALLVVVTRRSPRGDRRPGADSAA